MILRLEHVTTVQYERPVELAAQLLHLQPRLLANQDVLDFTIETEPAPERIHWGTDHFGNPVAWLFLDRSHEFLRVALSALVDVRPLHWPEPAATPAWEEVAAAAMTPAMALEAAEFVFASPMVPLAAATRAYAAESFPPGRAVLAGLLDLMDRIGRDFRFDPEVTTVSTPVERVMQLRAGVCQDFAHLMISSLRGLGLPARYVSGYLRTRPPPGQPRLRGADQSHAWVSCWLGAMHGWIDLDPTNNLQVADEHVVLAWGRDYADISPIRGVLLGGGQHVMMVSVDMEPVPDRAA